MRICLLSSGHKPDDDRIFYKEARSLAKIYDDVWIISPYISKIPAKKDGVRFLSIPTYPRDWFGRFKTIRELYNVALGLKADIYHCHEPESLLTAIELKRVLGCKVIFDSHEMYSATLAQRFPKYLHNLVMAIYKFIERSRINKCDFAIGATWSISEYLSSIVGTDRTYAILNCSLSDIFGEAKEKVWGEEIILCHDGSLPFSRGLITMIKAVDMVRKRHKIKFKIVGDVFGEERKWLESYIRIHGMENVIERTGWLDYKEVGSAISECHIGLVALENVPNHVIAAPNKVFNYMYFGMPFIAPDHCLGINKLIEEEKCGLLADSNSARSYANAICYLIENHDEMIKMGINAKEAADTKYSWPMMEEKLFYLYRQLDNK